VKISELSRRSGISVPTIKYYLREGLLPPGISTAPNQADYGEDHLHRLRLIRALMDVGGLGVGAVRKVLQAVGDERIPMHQVLGVAHHALGPLPDIGPVPQDVVRARSEVDRFVASLGWNVSADAPARRALADTLVALRRLGLDYDVQAFRPYAEVAYELATRELEHVRATTSRADAVESAIVGTVVFEAALMALRRLAQEHHSAKRFGRARRR
jgi:DNA-binding transcriptional MerR regulator